MCFPERDADGRQSGVLSPENFSDEQRERMNRDFLAAKKKVKIG
jgi:hypothetical protein